jgi:hypothetical protein
MPAQVKMREILVPQRFAGSSTVRGNAGGNKLTGKHPSDPAKWPLVLERQLAHPELHRRRHGCGGVPVVGFQIPRMRGLQGQSIRADWILEAVRTFFSVNAEGP